MCVCVFCLCVFLYPCVFSVSVFSLCACVCVFVFVCVCMYVLLLALFSWIFLDLVSETLGQIDPWNFRRRLVRYYFGNSWHCSSLDSPQTVPLFDCLHCFRDTRRLVLKYWATKLVGTSHYSRWCVKLAHSTYNGNTTSHHQTEQPKIVRTRPSVLRGWLPCVYFIGKFFFWFIGFFLKFPLPACSALLG